MRLMGWLGMGLGVWLIDQAVKNQTSPLRSLRDRINAGGGGPKPNG